MIVLPKPHNRASNERITAEVVLSVFAKAVRYHMLLGRRLLILVQSDDPILRLDGSEESRHAGTIESG
jgi:hypothetical protein